MRSVYSFRIVKLWNYMTGFFPLVYEWIYFLCINLIMFIITWASCGKACISHIVYSPSIKALSSCLRRRWLPGSPCPLWTRMGNLLRNPMSFHDDRGLNGKTYKKKLHIAVEMTWTVLWPIGSSPHKRLQLLLHYRGVNPQIRCDLITKFVNTNPFATWPEDLWKTYLKLLCVS